MREEPKIGNVNIVIDTSNEPIITDDFSGMDLTTKGEPTLGIEFAPVAVPVATPTETVDDVAGAEAGLTTQASADVPVVQEPKPTL